MRAAEADFAMSVSDAEANDLSSLRNAWSWTGWQRRHWPANVEWVGRRVYAFDKRGRRFCALVEITHGGSFEYRTWRQFRDVAQRLCGWRPRPHPHQHVMPFAAAGRRPCVGFAVRWKVLKSVDVPFPIRRFPRIAWLKLDGSVRLDALAPDTADLYSDGGVTLRQHREVERNPQLRIQAREYWTKRQGGRIRCWACGFDFEKVYGKRGRGFIEMHHDEPLAEWPERRMKAVTELVPVCSNCHRMLHRRRHDPWTPEELSRVLRLKKTRRR